MWPHESGTGTISEGERHAQLGRRILPILVRQARCRETIQYGQLAEELDYGSALSLRHPLGAIGNSLLDLAGKWVREIPPLQGIVVNKSTSLPGAGFWEFSPDPAAFRKASKQGRKRILDRIVEHAFDFPDWDKVLIHFGLQPAESRIPLRSDLGRGGGGGESDLHRRMKRALASNPRWIRLPQRSKSEVEHPLPSGDKIDVLFDSQKGLTAAEAKTSAASQDDVRRGLFQCIKYEAVLVAVERVEGRERSCESMLALGGELPENLRSLRNALGVTVIENVGGDAF